MSATPGRNVALGFSGVNKCKDLQTLIEIEFLDPDNPKKLMPRLRRLFSRTGLETEEVNILRGIATQIIERRKRLK